MVLAAGYGTRLRPLTDRLPKPLIPVAGRAMIDYALAKLQEYGIKEVVINVSHLKVPLLDYLAARPGLAFRISDEEEPLETGGGIKKALPLLGTEPFFTINSDIIWTDEGESALDALTRCWNGATTDILLLAHPRATAGGYDRGEDHLFIKPDNTVGWVQRHAPYVFAGVTVLHPRVFEGSPEGKFSVKRLWQRAMAQGRLFCVPHHGRWFQTGTIQHLQEAERWLKQMG